MMNKKTFIEYYNKEIEYLRKSGEIFSNHHPQIARNLKINEVPSSDPHIERLIESFAFIAGRINKKIDENFLKMGEALLNVLYPHHTRPTPSMMIANFEPANNPTFIPKGTQLYAYSREEQEACHFSTTYPLKIWPIQLKEVSIATFEYKQYLKFSLDMNKQPVDEILFHICADKPKALKIFFNLFSLENRNVFFSNDEKNIIFLGNDILEEVGFEEDETMLPTNSSDNYSYQLLQEFFHFPEKFLFFRFKNLNRVETCKKLDLYVPLREDIPESLKASITHEDFKINDVPIINLFETTTDPIKVDDRIIDHRIIADQRKEETHEIYDILEVYSGTKDGNKTFFQPFFSFQHHSIEKEVYWILKRKPSEFFGTDVYLSFVKRDYDLTVPPTDIVFAKILCTNRDLTQDIQPNTFLYSKNELHLKKITTSHYHPPHYKEKSTKEIWKLISQLSVNQISFSDSKRSLNALKEILALHCFKDNDYNILANLKAITTKNCVHRFGPKPWLGFTKGTEVCLFIDKTENLESLFLLASIIRYFFAMNISINSFLKLRLIDQKTEENISTFPLIQGIRPLI